MKVNIKKTKSIFISREEGRSANLVINGQQVEQVATFKYLGAVMTEKGAWGEEANARIAMAKSIQQVMGTFDKRSEERFEEEDGQDIGMLCSVVWLRNVDNEKGSGG
jgi:hypothetical protein